MYLNTYDYEKLFFDLDDNLLPIRNLKEKYIQFNASYLTDKAIIENQLNKLIDEYQKCSIAIFRDFSKLLRSHKQEIINSFTFIKDDSGKVRRLSNGPIEGYNRIPKDYRRISRGLNNFEDLRTRLIWANRENEPFLGIPKSEKEGKEKL